MKESLKRLATSGFSPRLVIDVGAYHGDFAAYALETWPKCRVRCFEPQPGKKARIEARFDSDERVRVYPELLSRRSHERLTLSLVETASSVLKEHVVQHEGSIELSSWALDDWWQEHGEVDSPDLVKLDVQGYELEILKGSEALLKTVSVVIAEVNLLDIHAGVPLVDEFSSWLADRGFVAFDVAGLTRRPLDQALWQMDLVYVKRDGSLRADKRWAP